MKLSSLCEYGVGKWSKISQLEWRDQSKTGFEWNYVLSFHTLGEQPHVHHFYTDTPGKVGGRLLCYSYVRPPPPLGADPLPNYKKRGKNVPCEWVNAPCFSSYSYPPPPFPNSCIRPCPPSPPPNVKTHDT